MALLDNLNAALDYIEQNLESEVSYAEIERVACCSRYQFMRMFSAALDVSLAEYIRRRRLTLAAVRLQNGERVIDTAFAFGYASPDAFARAFRAQHGVSPREAQQNGVKLTAYPRVVLALTVKGVAKMDYKIEQKPAFRIVGFRKQFSTEDDGQMALIPKMWGELTAERCEAMRRVASSEDFLGVCEMTGDGESEMDYWIAVRSGSGELGEFESREIPAATWAVFESVGPMPGAIQDVAKRVYGEWFASSGYKRAAGPDIENYPPGDNASPDYRCEVWVPVESD